MSDEIIKCPAAFNNSLASGLNYIDTRSQVKFDGSCLKYDKVTFTHKQVVNIYIIYEINLWPFNIGKDFVLGNSLFGSYRYTGYGIGFDACESFSLSDVTELGKTVIISGADMSSSVHIDN